MIKAKKARRVEKVVLMGLSAVTHSTNVGQRYVPLDFSYNGGKSLTVQMVEKATEAPLGYYMLLAVDNRGVPSKAAMIRAQAPSDG